MRWFEKLSPPEAQLANEAVDHGFMYGHGFQDLDGHIWELIYMEPNAVQ